MRVGRAPRGAGSSIVDGSSDVAFAVDVLGGAKVMRSTEKPEVCDAGVTSESAAYLVIELQPGASGATRAVGPAPGATEAVTLGDSAASGPSDVWWGWIPSWLLSAWWRSVRRRLRRASAETSFHEIVDEEFDGALHDRSEVTIGDGVAKQIARELELLFENGVRRELHFVSALGQGLDRAGTLGRGFVLRRRASARCLE